MTTRLRRPPSEQLSDNATVAWHHATGSIPLDSPLVMGILNITPDSFSDGGQTTGVDSALVRARDMIEAGAGVLDVGGESTRPGAREVPVDEELERVVPVVRALVARFDTPVSVDTRKAAVARAAIEAGAVIVNDVSGLAFDPDMGSTVAASGAGVVIMHTRGTPAAMRAHTDYGDLVGDVLRELEEGIGRARAAGVPRGKIVIDPGIGFAKTAGQSLALLGHTDRFAATGFPVLVGPSRKSFLGEVLGVPPAERAVGTAAACVIAYQMGARIFRVHDVTPTVQALAVARAVAAASGGSTSESGQDGDGGMARAQ